MILVTILILIGLSVILNLYCCKAVWGRTNVPGKNELIWMLLLDAWWSFFAIFEIAANTGTTQEILNIKLFWTKIEYVSISSIAALWLLFVLRYIGIEPPFIKRNTWVLFIIPALTLFLVWTNEINGGLMYSLSGIIRFEDHPLLKIIHHGLYFPIAVGYSWIVTAIGIGICFVYSLNTLSSSRMQLRLLFVAAMIPLLSTILYVFEVGCLKYFDLTPLFFAIIGALLTYALLKHRLVELTPIAVNTIFENIQDGVIVLNEKTAVVELNPAARKMFMINGNELYGKLLRDILPELPDIATMNKERLFNDQLINNRWYDIRFSSINNDSHMGWILTMRDNTTKRELEEKLHRMAYYDGITGLPNRMSFRDRLQSEMARVVRTHEMLAVMFIDLDNFKEINDTQGHAAGDKMLNHVAERLNEAIRGSDMAARMGGDEFLVLITDMKKKEDVAYSAMRILDAMREPFYINDTVVYTTASIGIAIVPGDGVEADIVLRRADEAMYIAKTNGKNQFMYRS
jgi:diguanylate cyclase (GGDEF)-like protein